MTRTYRVYGGRLASELPFPELAPERAPGGPGGPTGDLPGLPAGDTRGVGGGDAPDWRLRVVRDELPPPAGARVGEKRVAPAWTLRLSTVEGGHRFEYGETGAYDLVDGGRSIRWYSSARPGAEAVARSVVLGPVLALALERRGFLCLHGSAVSIGGRAVAFLAPKRHGKSTLAWALARRGARLVTDDMVVVSAGEAPHVRPGTRAVRLDVAALARLGRPPGATVVDGGKPTVARLPRSLATREPRPLAAIYLLEPDLPPGAARAAVRTPVSGAEAVARVSLQRTLPDPLAGPDAGRAALRAVARTLGAVPVYRLRTAGALDRVPMIARAVLGWHDRAAVRAPTPPVPRDAGDAPRAVAAGA